MACMEYGKFPYEVFSLCFVYKIKKLNLAPKFQSVLWGYLVV